MKEFIQYSDVEQFLQHIDGESIPIVFIDHLIIFYMDGTVKEVSGEKINQLFPKITHTTMGILKDNKDIQEINVKVDMDRVHQYLNMMANNYQERFDYMIERLIKKKKEEDANSTNNNEKGDD